MPGISRFYGITIKMYFKGHSPPLFHAEYGSYEALYGINDLEMINEELPSRAGRLVKEWAMLHQDELMRNWERANTPASLTQIDPLD